MWLALHRLLQLRPGGDAAFDRDHLLDADLVVVDEASMLDVLLANKLVKAIPSGAQLLRVGDVDQLPSVGAGEVLRDLLAAERLPKVPLTKVFRQAQRSGVVTSAHCVNAGQPPITWGLADFFLFPEDEPEQVADLVVDIVANRLPRRFGLDSRRDVQVLCPMHRGPAGAGVVNERLQAALTPAREGLAERRFGGRVYRVGDKVMQLRNNYDKGTAGVFNGSVGGRHRHLARGTRPPRPVGRGRGGRLRVRRAGRADPCLCGQHVPLPRQRVPLCGRAGDDQRLADAAAQSALHGCDRAKRIVVLVGSRRALAKAVRTQGAGRRYTTLTSGCSRDGPGPLRQRQSAGLGRAGCNRFRLSPRSGFAIGSGRQDGQGDARAAHRMAVLKFRMRSSVTWFACTAWDEVAKNASLRP
jgi:exodeoxyribonuclease V alpha subunit